jgi:hypothetical protein
VDLVSTLPRIFAGESIRGGLLEFWERVGRIMTGVVPRLLSSARTVDVVGFGRGLKEKREAAVCASDYGRGCGGLFGIPGGPGKELTKKDWTKRWKNGFCSKEKRMVL